MSNRTVYKKIALIGGGGSLGSAIISGLLSDPAFTVTVVQRASSKSKISSAAKVITVPDDYPVAELTKAFQDQDVVINAITTLSASEQYSTIDAAIAAGVKRYVPSEFGLNNVNPDAMELSPIFKEKGLIQKHLQSKESAGLTWTSFTCGVWLAWTLQNNFLGVNLPEHKFVVWDDGEGYFSTTTLEDTATAVVSALKKPEETANQNLFISNFATNQAKLFEAIERLSGEKFKREYIDSKPLVEDSKKRYEAGEKTAAYALIQTGFATGRYGGHLEKEGPLANEVLGVPKRELDDVVRAALKAI